MDVVGCYVVGCCWMLLGVWVCWILLDLLNVVGCYGWCWMLLVVGLLLDAVGCCNGWCWMLVVVVVCVCVWGGVKWCVSHLMHTQQWGCVSMEFGAVQETQERPTTQDFRRGAWPHLGERFVMSVLSTLKLRDWLVTISDSGFYLVT